ncbi:zinc-finger associated domain containing protein, partial [Oryctes borbonicus]
MEEKSEDICRTCLGANKNMFNIFTSGNPSDTNLADMLMTFVSLNISSEEDLPHFMCSDCIKTLTISYNFKKQCERSDVLLRSNKNEAPIKKQDAIEVVMTDEFVVENEIESEEENTNSDIFNEFEVNKNKKFSCNLCGRSFIKSGNLSLHMKTHKENNECTYCNSKFASHQELLQHNKRSHKYFNCTICDKSYATGNALNAHMRMHKSPNTAKSEENAEYICVVGINEMPIKAKHLKFEGEIEMMEKNITTSCSQCSLPCINEEALQLHEKIHDANHECEKCSLIFVAYTDFVEHNKTVHSIHNCNKCVKSFPTVYGLSGHSSTHVVAEENPCIMYKCTVPSCNKKYRTLDYLKQHILLHTNENKVYLCKVCGKTYNSSNSFYYHKKIHGDQRPYVCKYCGNAYKIYSHLKTHMWRHGTTMPHRCGKCGKGFTRGQVLRKHLESNCGSKRRRKHIADTTTKIEEEEDDIGDNADEKDSEKIENAVIANEA